MKNEDKAVRQKYRENLAMLDFRRAREFAQHLLKKGWHKHEAYRRGAGLMHQTAYTTAFVVTYWRPFSNSRGWKPLDIDTLDLTQEERTLHDALGNLRNQVHAHTDHNRHDREPWVGAEGSCPINVITAPAYHLSKEHLEGAVKLLDKLIGHFSTRRVITPSRTNAPSKDGRAG
jgi:hypothetical protein